MLNAVARYGVYSLTFVQLHSGIVYINTLIPGNLLVWVLAEDVLDDHNGLLHHIVDLGLNEVQQCADTTFC